MPDLVPGAYSVLLPTTGSGPAARARVVVDNDGVPTLQTPPAPPVLLSVEDAWDRIECNPELVRCLISSWLAPGPTTSSQLATLRYLLADGSYPSPYPADVPDADVLSGFAALAHLATLTDTP
ncbi:MAG: hypothetical protein GY913_00050 [Proteobacteria bacterium]|nr:hypothetical protein [Pseudomonadota bacterium]